MELLWQTLLDLLTPQPGWSLRLVVRVVLSTTLLFGYIVLLARTFGARTFATFTSFDFLSNVAAGSLVASAILGRSVVESALSLLVLALLQWGVSALSARSARFQAAVDNSPVVLVQNGQVLEDAMRRSRVSRATLDGELRASGLTEVVQVRFAVLESGGKISIVKRDG
jgi:uncharacterized membrane protein YcaP (DUF421 family)